MQPPPGADVEEEEGGLLVASEPSPRLKRALLILWPSFLMAGVLEGLIFVVVDPASLHWFGGARLDWPATAVYSVTFFIIWVVIAAAGVLTWLLEQPVADSQPRRIAGDG